MGYKRSECMVLWRNLREREHLEDTGTDESVTLSDLYINRMGRGGEAWIAVNWLMRGTSGGMS